MKPTTPRSTAHLAFIRERPCAWCGRHGPSEASHHGQHGTALKPSDFYAIPLCSRCHRGHHSASGLPGSSMSREQRIDWYAREALKVCEARLVEIEKGKR